MPRLVMKIYEINNVAQLQAVPDIAQGTAHDE